jgi:hypothetical protein
MGTADSNRASLLRPGDASPAGDERCLLDTSPVDPSYRSGDPLPAGHGRHLIDSHREREP